jgi:cobyrinic acid a,c-diamide synthase
LAKALVVAAPQSGSGKTLFTLGLIRALRNRGLKVASAKVGPDYIDPQFHAAASGSPCVNLDLWSMGEARCRGLLAEACQGQDIVVVEGVMGLFDGPAGGKGSTADLAEVLGLPIILLIDASHQAQSIGALVHGFRTYRPTLNVVGVVLNRVRSDRHLAIMTASLGCELLGALRQSDLLHLPSRHLGLLQAQEFQSLETLIEDAASAVTRETFVDKLFQAGAVFSNHPLSPALPPLGQRIAIARDPAFSFCYPHIVSGWRQAGAEISDFSPMNNEVPAAAADAVYLPGGYPELHAGKLAAASRTIAALKSSDAMVYGECGGYMFLGQSLIDAQGVSHPMAGLLPHVTSFEKRKLHLGYRHLRPLAGPWTTPLRGHEFHYSTQVSTSAGDALFKASDAAGTEIGLMGMRRGKVMGSYAHVISEAP